MSTMRTIKRAMLKSSGLPKRMVKKIANEARLYVVVEKPADGKKIRYAKPKGRKMGVRYAKPIKN